ncbi:disulfide bond formation protein B [Pseudobdellovibrio sp. HCB154]|uniref:disulfide bond formation protein B n=1 Tax=Pseudobdellovibrio sp. HCB154 TaxID=3386277 RepID=UPI003916E25E
MQHKISMYLAWGIALFATATSLIFSELLKYPPCSLCWYQRVFMYSAAVVIPTGILIQDKNVSKYALVLSVIGFIIAGYHSLIYHNVIGEVITVCTEDLSCKTKQFELFGVLSIPAMSLLGFLGIAVLSFKGIIDEKRS